MRIEQAQPSAVPEIAAVLQEAADWLAADGRPLWSAADIGYARVARDVERGLFFAAWVDDQVVGVMKFELEDPYFWPEIAAGSSAFVHKLAVRRAWAGKGVSTGLLAFARARAQQLGRHWLRLDCVADRTGLRALYERAGFHLHSCVQKGRWSFARYEIESAG